MQAYVLFLSSVDMAAHILTPAFDTTSPSDAVCSSWIGSSASAGHDRGGCLCCLRVRQVPLRPARVGWVPRQLGLSTVGCRSALHHITSRTVPYFIHSLNSTFYHISNHSRPPTSFYTYMSTLQHITLHAPTAYICT